jgi:hypothetical protein
LITACFSQSTQGFQRRLGRICEAIGQGDIV